MTEPNQTEEEKLLSNTSVDEQAGATVADDTPKSPLEALQQENDALKAELTTMHDKLLRLAAEFENSKRRSEREQQNAIKFANERLLQELLPVLDNLEHAANAGQANSQDPVAQTVVAGVKMVLKQFGDTLEQLGITSFSALGQLFNPNEHEAMQEQESATAAPGTVILEYQKGYKLNGRLVRPARVIVAKAPSEGHATQH